MGNFKPNYGKFLLAIGVGWSLWTDSPALMVWLPLWVLSIAVSQSIHHGTNIIVDELKRSN